MHPPPTYQQPQTNGPAASMYPPMPPQSENKPPGMHPPMPQPPPSTFHSNSYPNPNQPPDASSKMIPPMGQPAPMAQPPRYSTANAMPPVMGQNYPQSSIPNGARSSGLPPSGVPPLSQGQPLPYQQGGQPTDPSKFSRPPSGGPGQPPTSAAPGTQPAYPQYPYTGQHGMPPPPTTYPPQGQVTNGPGPAMPPGPPPMGQPASVDHLPSYSEATSTAGPGQNYSQSNLPNGARPPGPIPSGAPPLPQGQMPPGPTPSGVPPLPQAQMPPGPTPSGVPPLPQGQIPPGPYQQGGQPTDMSKYPRPQPRAGLPPNPPSQAGPPAYSQFPYGAQPGMPPNSFHPQQGHMPNGPGPGMPPGPPQPGFPGGYPGQPGMSGQPYPQPSQQAQRRLDPELMPSVIAVMDEDQQARGGVFITNQKGLLPPLVTTKFLVDDQGNCSPRFLRSTMYSVPALPDMLKQATIPFALIVNPFESPNKDEQPIPCVDLGPIGPVRCIRCKAYMSPLMQFIDGGRRFQCLLCKATTEVPPEYFQHLDHTGQRLDKWERPELLRGTYEFIATSEYCRNNTLPKEPGYIFVIDVSYSNIKSGLVNLLCSNIKSLLELLPSHTPVGFITYNSKVHFYNIDPALAQPQMVIVPDVSDMFMPLLAGFLVSRAEAASSIDMLMDQIPTMFADAKETDSVLGSAVVAGMEALKASDRAGKLLVFHSTLPVSDSVPNAKLKNREGDRKLLGTDKEKSVLTPQTTYYNNLGQECVAAGVSVDLYLFNNSYIDVATIGQVARITGGSVNKYTYFQAEVDGARVIGELQLHLGRPVAFDAVMRVRTSTGVRPVDFFGHFYMSNTTDVELAACDSQKAIAVEIKHDDKLTDEDGVYIQVALLYTSIFGQRKLRIHNIALSTCTQMADLYRNCELDTIINFLAKQSISKSIESTPQAIKDGIINRCAQILATYRKHCANPSMPGQLILPECLKLLPLFSNCILKSDAVAGTSELTPDDRSWLMYMVMTMSVASSVHYFYPKLIRVTGSGVTLENPTPERCSADKLSDQDAYILENGLYIFLWIGSAVSSEWLQSIFGVSNLTQLNVEVITELPSSVTTDECLRLKALIRSLRNERQRHMRLTVIRQRDKMEMVMKKFLVEDRGTDGQPSYVDFLCHMHKEIRSLLNQ